ncbi:hypothetical protein HNR42_002341 [Deinobacterium chartae]|uniref:DUF1802 family protein n=1 Tax=Deinobacterium chartae TaxID=521158 RepID=A0A841I1F8_9DEIO|nr:DUF1802 family protein [Deinobacterium chartae]MBB6098906.1 hypothetical protein [Deinobacterium chartae]
MKVSSRYALKEWDTQVQALVHGEFALVVRKGGIVERSGEFEVEHRDFYLYPTFLHQNAEELRPGPRARLRPDPQPGSVIVPALGEIMAVWKVNDLERALALEPYQALTAAAIERRFHYRRNPWVHALLLRVAVLEVPRVLPETEQFLGCVSWVPLGEALEAPARLALPDAHLEGLRAELTALLGEAQQP